MTRIPSAPEPESVNPSAARPQTKTDGGTTKPQPMPTPSLCTAISARGPQTRAPRARRRDEALHAHAHVGPILLTPPLLGSTTRVSAGGAPHTSTARTTEIHRLAAALTEAPGTSIDFEGFPGSGIRELPWVQAHRGVPAPFLQLSAPAPDALAHLHSVPGAAGGGRVAVAVVVEVK
ncbi:hypothetical protein DFH08DRAFT_899393 [Mycena albidolilacea]|uniref:Uncharacterized protein n=1 Tax=Mycena albidolilacea TaxID=1033008 RepID=A0AAD6Z6A2_9AGAR|nr:hypothetical protein DFH08DRAFT_899393 [Mycena albidolilacea]